MFKNKERILSNLKKVNSFKSTIKNYGNNEVLNGNENYVWHRKEQIVDVLLVIVWPIKTLEDIKLFD